MENCKLRNHNDSLRNVDNDSRKWANERTSSALRKIENFSESSHHFRSDQDSDELKMYEVNPIGLFIFLLEDLLE